MGKSRIILAIVVSMILSTNVNAGWSRGWFTYYDNDGVKYTLGDSWGYYLFGLDEYKRYLSDHEDLGGHTIAKHVGVDFAQLRMLCSEVRSDKRRDDVFKTSYTTFNQAKWSIRKLVMINRKVIDRFKISPEKGINIDAKHVVNVQRVVKYRKVGSFLGGFMRKEYFYLYGRGINCNLDVFRKYETGVDYSSGRPVYRTIYRDQYSRVRDARAALRKKDGRWYIVTSFPLLNKK